MTMKVLKMNILGGMNELVKEIGDEDILMNWITYGIPDGVTEDDLAEIADDDECFADVCEYFAKVVKKYS